MFLKLKEFGGVLVRSEEPVPWSIIHVRLNLGLFSLYTAVERGIQKNPLQSLQ